MASAHPTVDEKATSGADVVLTYTTQEHPRESQYRRMLNSIAALPPESIVNPTHPVHRALLDSIAVDPHMHRLGVLSFPQGSSLHRHWSDWEESALIAMALCILDISRGHRVG